MKMQIQKISCGYHQQAILSNLSMDVVSGEILCILGPNGVGKTTLFKTIMGFLPTLSGNIMIDGTDIRQWPRKKHARHLAYVPQAHVLPFPFTVMDVVTMGRTSHIASFSGPSRLDIAKSEYCLDCLGIESLKDRIYTELSGGERQMVLIARALAQEPQVLLMDEPTSNLDFGNQIRVLEQINALAEEQGLAIIMTSHVPDHSFLCSAKVALLCRKNEFYIGAVDEVVTEENLFKAYGVNIKISDVYVDKQVQLKSCIPLLQKKNALQTEQAMAFV